MRHVKSERLKKLETELNDLQQWLKMGLVPNKELDKHKEEIVAVQGKIEEEMERLRFLRESGESDDVVAPKRGPQRTAYTEMPTIPDIDQAETQVGQTQAYDEEGNAASTAEDKEEETTLTDEATEGDTLFNPNRWREGVVDPDSDQW